MQLPLSLPGLYETGARRSGVLPQPRTRGECEGGREARENGQDCPHVLCRHHLLGELARRPEAEAVAAMAARLRGEWSGSCALDVAEAGGIGARELAAILGVSTERADQICYEAGSRMRRRLALDGLRP